MAFKQQNKGQYPSLVYLIKGAQQAWTKKIGGVQKLAGVITMMISNLINAQPRNLAIRDLDILVISNLLR